MDRPFHTQEQRRFNLMQISGVDAVITFDSEDELRKQIELYSPDIFVIGSDYMYKPIVGGEWAKEVKFFNRIEGFSTTGLLDE